MKIKTIQQKIESLKKKKLTSQKVVHLSEIRALSKKEAKTILVVDSNEIVRSALKRILEQSKYKVLTANDGIELSMIIEKINLDLILLDSNLPWVNGLELCEILKSHKSLKDLPLILTSDKQDHQEIQKGFRCGADDFVTKPYNLKHMLRVIEKNL